MKAILFDFGGTLDSDGLAWADRFFRIYKEQGLGAPRSEFNRAFYRADDTLAERFAISGLSLEETLRLQVGSVLSALSPVRVDLKEKIVSRFLEDCRVHFRKNRPVLERLSRRHRLGIVSNFYGNLESVLRSEGLRPLFAVVADSGVIGRRKPDPEIFLKALSAVDSGPEQSLMVGDSLERDMRGAEKLGMSHAFLSVGDGPVCCPRAWRLKELAGLEAFLEAGISR